jgi:hypothetical protein
MLASEAAVEKIDRRIRELWASHGRLLPKSTPADYARLWRQIDTLLDKRLELTT